ncbi:hypothetical protein BCR33DRAFT_219114 [Rhizoclosmatium globosum]|uniref:Uncharacterized protein n=1 Tax=Rhizoclosmatium globosum TaxID=329046 RepID=A0A1Y2CBK0_9FUNG|nr:hypothetical protein BCR33DRAFT_219114 [Rhizoclosmatium globosum]|eukprot:ORY44316.1 hypothetical protein BCR33DRAFT_219114 [Rhizoclosmatium globosum]
MQNAIPHNLPYPTITTLPPHEWYCALCLKTHGDDFGFLQEGSLQSLAQFQKVADGFKESYFRRKREQEGTGSLDGKVYVGEEEMEEEFWKLVEEDRFNEDGVEYSMVLICIPPCMEGMVFFPMKRERGFYSAREE